MSALGRKRTFGDLPEIQNSFRVCRLLRIAYRWLGAALDGSTNGPVALQFPGRSLGEGGSTPSNESSSFAFCFDPVALPSTLGIPLHEADGDIGRFQP